MKDNLNIIGAHGVRHKNDFYPTPPECTLALIEFLEKYLLLKRTDTIWEPACGTYDMVNVFKDEGYSVIASDITQGKDYLVTELDDKYDWIITNPPFNLATEFIKRSIKKKKPFALLLKSQFWHSAKRRELFYDYQPAFILPLTWRPDFTGNGASMLDMIWVVWLGNSRMTCYLPLKKPSKKERSENGT